MSLNVTVSVSLENKYMLDINNQARLGVSYSSLHRMRF